MSGASRHYEYAHRHLSIPQAKIDEEAYETDRYGTNERDHHQEKAADEEKKLQNFALNLSSLPQVPDAARNLAKLYIEGIQKSDTKDDDIASKMLTGIRSIGRKGASRNPSDALINRSFSQKSLGNKLPARMNSLQHDETAPKTTERIKELAQASLPDARASTLYHNPHTSSTNTPFSKLGSGFKKNIIVSQSQLPTNKLSPLPQKYKEHLPNIIKKKIHEATSTSFNFNPSVSANMLRDGVPSKKEQATNMEQIQSQLRHDVSYLNEPKSSVNTVHNKQATILTTGDKGQDGLLETTMGLKNIGKSLIHLPQTIDELHALLKTYEPARSPSLDKFDQDERTLDKFLDENFKHLHTNDASNLELPALSWKQFANNSGLMSSKYLKSQQQLSARGANPFNIVDPKKQAEKFLTLEKQPPFVNTRPDSLATVDNKLVRRFGEQAFLQKQDAPVFSKKRQTLPAQEAKLAKKDLHNSWMLEEKSTERRAEASLSPVNLKTSKQILKDQIITQISGSNMGVGNPSSRQDAVLLIVWFEKMLGKLQPEFASGPSETTFSLLQLVMNICVKELARQVSVQCTERGLLLVKLFQSYVSLVDIIYADQRRKRWTIKRDLTDKLDRYITIQEGQVLNYKDQIADYQRNFDRLKLDLEGYLQRLNQANVLTSKLKKKCFTSQQDLDKAQRQLKFMEKENAELRSKVQELSERCGEEVSEMDEGDRRRLLLKIESDMAKEKAAVAQAEGVEGVIDVDQIPDREIIKEEDTGTDMRDFEAYLIKAFGDKVKDDETQTDKVFRKHMKLGVTSHKLGLLKDKETWTDPRMFMTPGGVTQYRVGGGEAPPVKEESTLKEEDSDGEDKNQDDTLDDLAMIKELEQADDGVALDLDDLQQLKRSLSINQAVQRDLSFLLGDDEQARAYGTQEVDKIIAGNRGKKKAILVQDEDQVNDKTVDNNEEGKPLKSMMEVLTKRLKERLKSILVSDAVFKLQEVDDGMAEDIVKQVKDSGKEVKQIEAEAQKKEKQVRFQFKLNKKNEKGLKEALEKVDALEMDNYVLREQVQELVRSLDEYENAINDVLDVLGGDEEAGDSTDLKSRLALVVSKIKLAKQRALQFIEEDANKSVDNPNQFQSQAPSVVRPGSTQVIEEEKDDNSDPVPSQLKSNKTIMPIAGGQRNAAVRTRSSANLVGPLPSSHQDILKKRALTRFQLFNLGVKKKSPKRQGTHPGQLILRRIQQTDPKKIKDIMPRKMLLRVIYQIYQERGAYENQPANAKTADQGTSFQGGDKSMGQTQTSLVGNQQAASPPPLLEWIYDSFMQKYGLKNVAEKKFTQLLGSCLIMQNQIPRIRLFGRFVELYNELTPTEYNRYLEMVDLFTTQILNFKIDDDQESILLPVNRALDYYKLKFETKLLNHQFNQRIQKIEKMKVPVGLEEAKTQKHLKGVREAIDLDLFAELVIDTYGFIHDEREQCIKDMYLAVDVNNDGLMSLNEFMMLMKVTHYKSTQEILKLFEDYSSTDQDSMNPYTKFINLDQFTQMCIDKEYFSPRIQYNFCQSKNIEKDFDKLTQDLPTAVAKLRARLTAIDMQESFEYVELLENFQNNVKYPFSAKVGWICFRIVDEVFKRVYVRRMSDSFMPVDIKRLGLRTKLSQSIFNMLPVSLFDTA